MFLTLQSQVKSVRKELKMHLLRMLKHPACFTHHHQINQLLVELGASQSEIAKAMPAPSEVSEALKRRVAAARLDSMGQGGQKRTATVEEASGDVDLREIKRLKVASSV
jgi:symplekin